MDQQTLIGIGILGLLLASGGAGGDPTELIDEGDPALTGMDQFEIAAAEYEYDAHGPDAEEFDRYLGAAATRVSDWTDSFKDPDMHSYRLTQRIFDELTDLHQELKRWFAEKLSRWNTWFRKRHYDPHPRSAEFFGRFQHIVKQIEVLLSYDIEPTEEDVSMISQAQEINVFNQHIGGDTYNFQTNHMNENHQVNNDFKHHDQRTLNQKSDSYYDDRRYQSAHKTMNWGSGPGGTGGQVSMDLDHAVEATRN